jgi:hypothetical protein
MYKGYQRTDYRISEIPLPGLFVCFTFVHFLWLLRLPAISLSFVNFYYDIGICVLNTRNQIDLLREKTISMSYIVSELDDTETFTT